MKCKGFFENTVVEIAVGQWRMIEKTFCVLGKRWWLSKNIQSFYLKSSNKKL